MRLLRIITTLFIVLIGLASCDGQDPDDQQSIEPASLGLQDNDAFLQIDWVEIGEYTGDRSGNGEVSFTLYVIRQDGSSLQLVMPEEGTNSVTSSSSIDFENFNLRINDISPGEILLVYLLAFDRDSIAFSHNRFTSDALSEGGSALGDGFAKGLLSGRSISQTSIRTFILTQVSEKARDWWQQADFLGGFVWTIEPVNDWLEGKSYVGISDNNNLKVQLSITSASEFKFTDATPTVEPTMTSTPIEPAIFEITPQPTYVVGESFECEDAFEPHLEIGGNAKVVVYQVTVRRLPGLFSAPLNYYARDRILLVVDGPVCLNGLYWWKVQSDELGYGGWIAEADDENYFLEPELSD